MCLIIIKPIGIALPPAKQIKEAFKTNPDGFGLAYWQEGMQKVHICKGAMNLADIHQLIHAIPRPKAKAIVMHFRQATAGIINPGNTHPYPLTKRIRLLTTLEMETDIAVFHNGIIWEYSNVRVRTETSGTKIYTWEADNQILTDTQQFIKEYLVGMGDAIFNAQVQQLITAHTLSKFVLFSPHRLVCLGDFIKDSGRYYSGDSYLVKPDYKDLTTDKLPGKKEHTGFGDTLRCDLCYEFFKPEDLKPYFDTQQETEEDSMWLCPDCYQYYASPMYPFGYHHQSY